MSFVRRSTANEPPSGSTVSLTPDSYARICCVRSATRTACSVGRPSASSFEFVCSDWQPPSTAASACTVTRTTLFSGCCAVSMLPAVCAWKRSVSARGSRAPNRSRMMRAQSRRAARNFATSSSRLLCALKKNDSCGANASTASPASTAACTYATALASVNATSWTAVHPASRMW